MSGLAFIFPGQGSQSVGMLTDLNSAYAAVKDTFDEASATLSYDLWSLVANGPEETLRLTEYTQPAILASSVAIYRCWIYEGGQIPAFVAGHSLGEYSALVAANSLSLGDAAVLVQTRGRAMQTAVPSGQGFMSAVIGLDDATIVEVCGNLNTDKVFVGVVNYNSPGQVVIAGNSSVVGQVTQELKRAGARKIIPLPVSAPFHTPLMQPAADAISIAFQSVVFSDAEIPVISNVDAQPYKNAEQIRRLLLRQICEPVLWTDCMQTLLKAGCRYFAECGPGKVLSGLMRRIDKGAKCLPLEQPECLKQHVLGDWI